MGHGDTTPHCRRHPCPPLPPLPWHPSSQSLMRTPRPPRQGSFLQLNTTEGGRGSHTTPPPAPPPLLKDWAKFSSGPSANQKFSLVPAAPNSLDQRFSSAPLKTQHRAGGGGGSLKGALARGASLCGTSPPVVQHPRSPSPAQLFGQVCPLKERTVTASSPFWARLELLGLLCTRHDCLFDPDSLRPPESQAPPLWVQGRATGG